MTYLSYPTFPLRPLLAVGVVLLGLGAAAIAYNESGPDLRGCTVAAARVMVARDGTIAGMEAAGPGLVPACGDLTRAQYAGALDRAYLIDYGKGLPRTPLPAQLPPPAYRALRARSALRPG